MKYIGKAVEIKMASGLSLVNDSEQQHITTKIRITRRAIVMVGKMLSDKWYFNLK